MLFTSRDGRGNRRKREPLGRTLRKRGRTCAVHANFSVQTCGLRVRKAQAKLQLVVDRDWEVDALTDACPPRIVFVSRGSHADVSAFKSFKSCIGNPCIISKLTKPA
jgi:hypothetical protein